MPMSCMDVAPIMSDFYVLSHAGMGLHHTDIIQYNNVCVCIWQNVIQFIALVFMSQTVH